MSTSNQTTSHKKRKTNEEPSPEILPTGTTVRSIAAATSVEKTKTKETTEPNSNPSPLSRPTFDFTTLPSSAIHRYLLYHQLISPNSLNYDHALFPTRPITLPIKQEANTIVSSKSSHKPSHHKPLGPMTLTTLGPTGSLSFLSIPPNPAPSLKELRSLTAFDDAEGVLGDRLSNLARTHWDHQNSSLSLSREQEILASFVYSIKTRGKALRPSDR
ncbi:uncharacterized protein MELLADRAFT_102242 [Melampsora larici-populina 98AG31]|uniref:Uncharacterized protein n=1 Tax=Melampsora larici-populina (strain 98AG31 / pathotype 3-4-7) TaxID=747676 RepID=F4R7N2_MELLP|nr:uncharacterized protein MELLADRAFT_102242 [Melampsora larici-populina 98AG31]EGG11346.1 hypothetical protein MELLADRAFT_102242 [Melampsora larici-populina 98AG31]